MGRAEYFPAIHGATCGQRRDEIECQLREIAENLHRAELTALERDDHIARWVELVAAKTKGVQSEHPFRGGPQPKEKGQAKAARELGISRPDAHRAVKVASLSDEAKQAARETGLDKNRSALLKAAKESAPAEQVRTITELALAKVAKPQKPADPPLNDFETTERQVSALMSAWNRAGREAREQFLSRIDQPLMDQRYV